MPVLQAFGIPYDSTLREIGRCSTALSSANLCHLRFEFSGVQRTRGPYHRRRVAKAMMQQHSAGLLECTWHGETIEDTEGGAVAEARRRCDVRRREDIQTRDFRTTHMVRDSLQYERVHFMTSVFPCSGMLTCYTLTSASETYRGSSSINAMINSVVTSLLRTWHSTSTLEADRPSSCYQTRLLLDVTSLLVCGHFPWSGRYHADEVTFHRV